MNIQSQVQGLTKEWIILSHKLIYIIFASFIFSGELEVDGDLTVTGNIQNQTIDSLLQVIADLQRQLSALQVDNKLETRVYNYTILFEETINYNLDLYTITNGESQLIAGFYFSKSSPNLVCGVLFS